MADLVYIKFIGRIELAIIILLLWLSVHAWEASELYIIMRQPCCYMYIVHMTCPLVPAPHALPLLGKEVAMS